MLKNILNCLFLNEFLLFFFYLMKIVILKENTFYVAP